MEDPTVELSPLLKLPFELHLRIYDGIIAKAPFEI